MPKRSFPPIASVDQGVAERLVESTGEELAGDWSPDGKHYVYLQGPQSSLRLAILSLGASSPAVPTAESVDAVVPAWSPTGEWIAFRQALVWKLTSPDGKQVRSLGADDAIGLVFTNDGRELYGIHHATAHWSLFRIDVATARLTEVRDLSMEHRPATLEGWSGRLAFMQDGNHILYSTGQFDSSLWLLRGFQPPRLVDRLLGRFLAAQRGIGLSNISHP